MDEKLELKPCPFCGSPAKLYTDEKVEGIVPTAFVSCTNPSCGVFTGLIWSIHDDDTPNPDYIAQALRRWNRRHEFFVRKAPDELRPCPFCGSPARLHVCDKDEIPLIEEEPSIAYVSCENSSCYASMDLPIRDDSDYSKQANRQWNRRYKFLGRERKCLMS